MKIKGETWAIIPSRSGSKGFKDKNISTFLGIPLLAHSINFAKKLSFIDRIVLSTDSEEYAKIGIKYGAEIPFLRSSAAAADDAMEQDVLIDISRGCEVVGMEKPETIVWLRPTHPLRCVNTFEKAFKQFKSMNKSVCIVVPEDSRIFVLGDQNELNPVEHQFLYQSMVRRQDSVKAYRIFHGEIFNYPDHYNPQFLGDNWTYVEMSKMCSFDIDDEIDLMCMEIIIQKKRELYAEYTHPN